MGTPFTHTIACQDRDFPEWHGGRRHALVWALELDGEELDAALASARARLADLLLPRYERQPHVTVAFAGLAAASGLSGYDEERLAADLARLSRLCRGPVTLHATGWGSFPMVPYLAVEGDWLFRARAQLDDGRYAMSYVPHVSVGHWAGEWEREAVLARMAAPVPTQSWRVAELSLLRYETHDIAGPLEAVGRLDLRDGTWRQFLEA